MIRVKKSIFTSLVFTALALCSLPSFAQLADMDESKLYAASKQVNQFFHRFNAEEDEKGNRYYEGNKQFRNEKLRKKYLGTLFDDSNSGITNELKVEFAKNVLDKKIFLDFHNPNWFAEVATKFTVNGKDETVTLYLVIEKDHLGYKWVIDYVQADIFDPYFVRDTTRVGRFIHPMSHELDFMTLRKAFVGDSISQFTVKKFNPDQTSLFLYELKKGNWKFKTVENVSFHFFQIDGWYFELSNFNRPGYNTGWLISNLVKLKSPADKEVLLRFLHHGK